jgi:RHH-type rel operon transcriptional repressor/antitoxin RelB
MLAIRLTRDIEDRLDKLAKKTGRTKTYYAREAILGYLADQEDFYLAASRVARNMKRIPLKVAGKRLAREETLPPTNIIEEVRRLGLSTPSESTRMIRGDRDAR